MSRESVDSFVADKVELAISQIEGLFSLPFVISQSLLEVGKGKFSAEKLAKLIESDPGLTLKVLGKKGSGWKANSVADALRGLSSEQITEMLLEESVTEGLNYFPELLLHSNVCGWCAGKISQVIVPKMDPNLAYLAGLLHNVGKLGIAAAMPKSFELIAEQSKERKVGTRIIEREQLGVDHTIIGKRLCQKWGLAKQILLAGWLHHSDSIAIAQRIPEARLVQIVQLAGILACEKLPDAMEDYEGSQEDLAKALSIPGDELEQIEGGIDELIEEKSELLGIGREDSQSGYSEAVKQTAVKLAKETSSYSQKQRRLARSSGQFEFTKELLVNINSQGLVTQAAEKMAKVWQEFYQTGKVFLWVKQPGLTRSVKGALAQGLGKSKPVILDLPDGSEVIPKQIAEKFDILESGRGCEWLFEQLESDFDLTNTKVIPLLKDSRAVGAVAFEFNYPMSDEYLRENFSQAALAAGSILDLVLAQLSEQRLTEKFANLTAMPKQTAAIDPDVEKEKIEDLPQAVPQEKSKPEFEINIEDEKNENLLDAVTEIAAGAAHELNNPLSVISGRAELLSGSETDEKKKESLDMIKKNAGELSSIVMGLMSYAKPQKPRAGQVDVSKLIEESIHLASQKMAGKQLDVVTDADTGGVVFVDSGQMVSALADIICNAVEAYQGIGGVVQVKAETDEENKTVKIKIIDHGCGMDEETLHKAKQPFFSAKPAGRKRGMGLAYADRYVQLNGGKLDITSSQGQGTAVTVSLPAFE